MDGNTVLVGSLAIQALGAAFTYGALTRASRDHDRRIGVVETDTKEQGERISTIEGRLQISVAARAGS